MKLKSLTATGRSSSITASDSVFGVEPNQQLLAQAVRVYRSNQRQGSGAAKTRAQVIRTKKKWFRQKGTGNARHGARSAHIFVGGGVAHGPKTNQNWSLSLSKTMKRKALASALSAQAAAEAVLICDPIEKLKGKTKEAAALIQKAAPETKRVLVILSQSSPEVIRSLSNLENVLVTQARLVTPYEILLAHKILTPKSALPILEERCQ